MKGVVVKATMVARSAISGKVSIVTDTDAMVMVIIENIVMVQIVMVTSKIVVMEIVVMEIVVIYQKLWCIPIKISQMMAGVVFSFSPFKI